MPIWQPLVVGVATRRFLRSRTLLSALGVLLLFTSGVGAALADGTPTTTTTTTTTTTVPSTSAPTTTGTTTSTTTTTVTTAATTTTTAPPSSAATTTTPSTTTARRKPPAPRLPASPVRELSLARGRAVAGLLVLLPHSTPLAVGAVADQRGDSTQRGPLVYRAGGSLVSAASVTVAGCACADGAQAELRSVSLFSGEVSATRVVLRRGADASATIVDLGVGGQDRASSTGTRIPLASWGELLVQPSQPIQTSAGGRATAALAIHLLRAHDGLPADTWLLVAAAALPAPAANAQKHHRKRKGAMHEPLKVTPPLANRHYIFPVVGPAEYGDTYGAFRSDVAGNWHHGDDIFAPLGTPVVAVASGTLNRVGWERLGGWRLWVRDGNGDEFYYAHLSGYAPTDLRSNRIKAGEVIGFVGNTGDAFTTSSHLHFEIHPRQLLRLHYDGAVDPTGYLKGWTRLARVDAPRPVHPPLPQQPFLRTEASFVFRELLVARHLIPPAPEHAGRSRGPTHSATQPLVRQAMPAFTAQSKGPSTSTVAAAATFALLTMIAASMYLPIGRLPVFLQRARSRLFEIS